MGDGRWVYGKGIFVREVESGVGSLGGVTQLGRQEKTCSSGMTGGCVLMA